jgi:hypothetical protein
MALLAVGATVPAAAVEAPISVDVDNPIAGELAEYTIEFHNVGLLTWLSADWIDVMFPFGTDLSTVTGVTVTKAASKAKLDTAPVAVLLFGYAVMPAPTGETAPRTMRIYLDDIIDKCEWVRIVITDVTNPPSCNHVLEVGTSAHTPVDSESYTIYSIIMSVCPDKELISLPAYPEDTKIEVVLADLFKKVADTASSAHPFSFSVWYYDASAKKWLKYASDSSFKDLKTMEAGKAYWIKVNDCTDFYFKGEPYPEDQGPPIKFCQFVECWNMVGIASGTDILASDYLKNTLLAPFYTEYAVDAIYYWDEVAGAYADTGWNGHYPAVVDPLLESGRGYWMSFRDAACIIPPLP